MERKYKISGFADEISDSLTTQIESLKKLDMHYVEMRGVDGNNLIYHSNKKVKEIKKRLDDADISLSALGSPLGKIGIEDPFEKHFEEFKRAIEVAHMMDAEYIRMFSFYVPENFFGESEISSMKNMHLKTQVFERIGKFVDYAKENDVVLLHENEKGIYGEKAKCCKELMENFGGEHFKAIFDFANFVQAGQDTLEAYEMMKKYIVYIHVKDAIWKNGEVVPAGYGDGNVKEILNSLFDSGFDGFLSIEPHLFNFKGFAGLEKEKNKPEHHLKLLYDKPLNGFEAFSLAHKALMDILK